MLARNHQRWSRTCSQHPLVSPAPRTKGQSKQEQFDLAAEGQHQAPEVACQEGTDTQAGRGRAASCRQTMWGQGEQASDREKEERRKG